MIPINSVFLSDIVTVYGLHYIRENRLYSKQYKISVLLMKVLLLYTYFSIILLQSMLDCRITAVFFFAHYFIVHAEETKIQRH